MAKTLEELQDAIKNVIAENDKGEITATALQTILLDMSETLSELGGSGGGQFDIYCSIVENTDTDTMEDLPFVTECTEEQKEINKQIYDKIAAGERCPLVLHVNDLQDYPEVGSKVNISSTCIYVAFSTNMPLTVVGDVPVSESYLSFIFYGGMMIGTSILLLIDSGEILTAAE